LATTQLSTLLKCATKAHEDEGRPSEPFTGTGFKHLSCHGKSIVVLATRLQREMEVGLRNRHAGAIPTLKLLWTKHGSER